MKRSLLRIAFVILLAAVSVGTAYAAKPGPAGPKYRLVFEDNFNTFDTSVWRRGLIWDFATPADSVYARNGILHINSRRAQGYPGINVTTWPARSFKQGYFEARIKMVAGKGHHTAFWMMSTNWLSGSGCPTKVSEFDIYEAFGDTPHLHDGALHRNTASGCGMPDETRPSYAEFRTDTGVNLSKGFHTFAGKWTETEVVWYLDGRELKKAAVYDTTDQPMSLILSSFVGYFGPEPDATTPNELDVQVDWVKVWQR